MSSKQYLGDSVYASSDGWHVILTTENGGEPANTIYLDDSVLNNLAMYIASLRKKPEPKPDEQP